MTSAPKGAAFYWSRLGRVGEWQLLDVPAYGLTVHGHPAMFPRECNHGFKLLP